LKSGNENILSSNLSVKEALEVLSVGINRPILCVAQWAYVRHNLLCTSREAAKIVNTGTKM